MTFFKKNNYISFKVPIANTVKQNKHFPKAKGRLKFSKIN